MRIDEAGGWFGMDSATYSKECLRTEAGLAPGRANLDADTLANILKLNASVGALTGYVKSRVFYKQQPIEYEQVQTYIKDIDRLLASLNHTAEDQKLADLVMLDNGFAQHTCFEDGYMGSGINKTYRLDGVNPRLLHGILGVASESGELANEMAKLLACDYTKDTTPPTIRFLNELGDLAWYMSLVIDVFKTTWAVVFDLNIKKLKQRFPKAFSLNDYLNKNESKENGAAFDGFFDNTCGCDTK